MKYVIAILMLFCFVGAIFTQETDINPSSPLLSELNNQASIILRKILVDDISELESAQSEDKLLMLFIIARVN